MLTPKPKYYKATQNGFSYLIILFLVASSAIILGVVTQNDDLIIQREKEADWLFMGNEYQRAIASYYQLSPNGIKALPKTVDDLLLDKRFVSKVRHLRKYYTDPLTKKQDWLFLKNQDDLIVGVYSSVTDKPLQPALINNMLLTTHLTIDEINRYSDVKFEFKPIDSATQDSNNADATGDELANTQTLNTTTNTSDE